MHCVILDSPFAEIGFTFRYKPREMPNLHCPSAAPAWEVKVKMSDTALVIKTDKNLRGGTPPKQQQQQKSPQKTEL